MKDYYKILEVDPKATPEEIKAQYHFLVHAWHPDKFPDDELKSKAEEKLKEINEAYSVLSDTSKRENYDRVFRSYSSQPKPQTQNSYTQPVETTSTQSQQKTQSIGYCQSCFLPAETKYVEFHENIGMVFMRQHRAVKGNLCKSCIDYYFWNFTGKTMLLGWWGIISFIVTPFILLNNLFRFIFTTGMKKPPLKIVPSPTPFWVFSTIGGFMLIGYFILSMAYFMVKQPNSYSVSPTTAPAMSNIVPTVTPSITIKVKTSTSAASSCIRWDEIDSSLVGRTVCVYGTIYRLYNTNEVSTRIIFTSQANKFFIHDVNNVYPDLKEGDCVVAEEVLQLYDNKIPYMSVSGELYNCESWMK